MKNILKKDLQKFVSEMKQFFGSLTTDIKEDEDKIKFTCNTSAGGLLVTIYKNEKECVYTVYSRFEDEKRGKMIVDCNPYSGKYNYHGGKEGGADWNIQKAKEFFDFIKTEKI